MAGKARLTEEDIELIAAKVMEKLQAPILHKNTELGDSEQSFGLELP